MLLCLGEGYVACHLRQSFDGDVWGTSRVSNQHERIVEFDGRVIRPELRTLIEKADYILVSIPPVDGQDCVVPLLLDMDLPNLKWLGYLSATSVYGDHQGEWVHEESPCHPSTPMGRDRFHAEGQWLATDAPVHIFRLSGIYGPGRSVFDRMDSKAPTCVDKEGLVFSRIHVADIVQTLKCSMNSPDVGQIYNLADDEPASSCDVMAFGCQLLGVSEPQRIPVEQAEISPRMRDFFRDSKKVCNEKIKEKLGINLLYPTYREGLRAIMESK